MYPNDKTRPRMKTANKEQLILLTPEDDDLMKVDLPTSRSLLDLEGITNPEVTIESLLKRNCAKSKCGYSASF